MSEDPFVNRVVEFIEFEHQQPTDLLESNASSDLIFFLWDIAWMGTRNQMKTGIRRRKLIIRYNLALV